MSDIQAVAEVIEPFVEDSMERSNEIIAGLWKAGYRVVPRQPKIETSIWATDEETGYLKRVRRKTVREVTGYDGSTYGVGDRVEIHPGTDLWMRGARYGMVVGISLAPRDRVRVSLETVFGPIHGTFAGTADTFRRAS